MSTENNQNTSRSIAELEKSIAETEKALKDIDTKSDTQHTIQQTSNNEGWWSVYDAMTISASILIFGALIMCLATILLYKGKSADEVLKLFGTIIIIVSAVFLVVAGYTDTQIAPVIGLLGTIAGYLLGRNEGNKNNDE